MEFNWPGNVRNRENVQGRSIVLAEGPELSAGDIRLDMAPAGRQHAMASNSFLPEGMTLDQYEQQLIKEALKRANGNKSQAAGLLGLTRNAFRYRLDQWGWIRAMENKVFYPLF